MKVLTTFPGKFGDLIWALPTVRAISEAVDEPVDLVIAGAFSSIVPLLQRQSYLGEVWADASWVVENAAPMTPRAPFVPIEWSSSYDQIFHLGYRGWPEGDLARETVRCAAAQGAFTTAGGELLRVADLGMFDLNRPWITAPYTVQQADWRRAYAVGFTDEHFELKYGLTELVRMQWIAEARRQGVQHGPINLSTSPRWDAETGEGKGWSWDSAAAWLADTPVFLGCCSALHVLARAMGVPVVLMEPNPHRWNDIFYPFGKSGKGVELVLGNDGQPTFDARAVWDRLQRTLAAASAKPGVASGDTITSPSLPTAAAPSGSNAPAVGSVPEGGLGLFESESLES